MARLLLLAIFAALLTAIPAFAGKRVALLIGNAAYERTGRLSNPPRDVVLLKKAFEDAGFDNVRTASDLGRQGMVEALRSFEDEAEGADVAVIYYSGHGMEIDGANYLIPVDARLRADRDAEDEALSLDRVERGLAGARLLKLIILDACRNNPFEADMARKTTKRLVTRGLARVEPGGATLIAYAAKAGTLALDGEGGANSPFAAALAKRIVEPGVDVRIVLGKVHDDVLATTGNEQEPFVYGSLGGTQLFLSALPAPASEGVEPVPVQTALKPAPDLSGEARNAIRRCDELAADPEDPDKPADIAGVEEGSLFQDSASRAVEACKVAVMHDPENMRLAYQLGRSLYSLHSDATDKEMIVWIRKAAEAEHAPAELFLGYLYIGGRGVETSDRESVRWMRRAAAQHLPGAMGALADTYAYTDPEKGARLMLDAMAAGDRGSAAMLIENAGGNYDDEFRTLVQKELATAGYDVGNPDGRFGARTIAALKEFKRRKGAAKSGEGG